ncbi:MAG: Flp pilus assembly complex ATPase component TadA [Candidatus Omnitrophica bacterium]|nr:Flp pilus assembly complex ATPase component TadA [Candidatus Omnitrophota bacterium]
MNKYAKKTVGELLFEKGTITREQLEQARSEEKKTGDSLFKVLPRLGFISQEQLADTVSEQASIPRIELGNQKIDPQVLDLIPEDLARKYSVVPVMRIANNLTCAMVDVFNVHAVDELVLKTGLVIEPAISTEDEIKKALDDHYMVRGNMQDVIKSLDDSKLGVNEGEEIAIHRLQDIGEEPPVVKFVNMMISNAVNDGASDIHIEPEERTLSIRFRVDGVLHQQAQPPKQFRAAIISRIKIMSSLDIAEHRKPQDGRIRMEIANRPIDIRVSFLPTVYGENVVMRLLDTGSINLGLEQIGLLNENLTKFRALLDRPNGIILVTGPTGSGKTTTLYSSVSTINSPELSIVTIEDPVEYRLPGIRQTQVDLKVDLTFARGLRAILRQDPDVIMVGEIRDAETAQIAIQAALTGHLVLATLHTNNAAGAITRLLDIGVEPFLLSSSIIGVVAQRLVRLFCKACDGRGCKSCSATGYKGRTGIYEMLVFNEQIRSLILRKASSDEIHRAAVSHGMKSLRDCGMEKVAEGLTGKEEVFRVTQEE